MASILGVGTATTDIIHYTSHYPAEDEEMRATRQRICRGGNACNTLVVLSQLGHQCAWAGSLASDNAAMTIREDLVRYHIDTSYVRVYEEHATPLSCITVNTSSGSRTIVHYRDLPEYPTDEFDRIDVSRFDWIHFEGRNIADTRQILQGLRAASDHRIRVSLEVEKARPEIQTLFDLADVIMFSRDYAEHCGYRDAREFLDAMRQRTSDASLITCTWGSEGAWAVDRAGTTVHVDAARQGRVVDTVGAGDVFNAGIIDALIAGRTIQQALQDANSLAGRKCSREGFDRLGDQVVRSRS